MIEKREPGVCVIPDCTPVWVLADALLIQLPAKDLEKVAEDGPRVWILAIHVGDFDEVPGSWLCPVLAITAMHRVNQLMEELCPFFSFKYIFLKK